MFKLMDKIAMGAVGVILITNPASSQGILDGLDVVFKLIFQYGSPINFLASGVIVGYIGYKIWDGRERTHIPKKSAKTKSMDYIKT